VGLGKLDDHDSLRLQRAEGTDHGELARGLLPAVQADDVVAWKASRGPRKGARAVSRLRWERLSAVSWQAFDDDGAEYRVIRRGYARWWPVWKRLPGALVFEPVAKGREGPLAKAKAVCEDHARARREGT
jgi:hypothetical protein